VLQVCLTSADESAENAEEKKEIKMSNNDTILTFTQTIHAPPAAVYYAFTHTAAIRGWLCNNAQIDARKDGRLYLHWNQGYYTSGEFTALEPDTSLTFTWRGRGEPTATTVHVSLEAEDDRTQVTLAHSDIGAHTAWDQIRAELTKRWENGLENLKSVLETGLDKRIHDRPFLGILIEGAVDEKLATKLGVPVTGGVHIGGAVPDTGAQAAGLRADDVIFSLGGVELTGFQSVGTAIDPYKAGDSVEVVFYRGGEKHSAPMELSRRPVPDVPGSPAEFALKLSQVYEQLDAELDAVFEGVSDQQAATPPQEGEWSAIQVLAHLILTERTVQVGIALQTSDRFLDAFPDNSSGLIEAIATTCSSVAEAIAAWKRAEAETVALVERLPQALVARKSVYLQIGHTLLVGLPGHTRGHYAQIQEAIAAIRQN